MWMVTRERCLICGTSDLEYCTHGLEKYVSEHRIHKHFLYVFEILKIVTFSVHMVLRPIIKSRFSNERLWAVLVPVGP